MRRLVLLCSAFMFLFAIADAQSQSAPAAAKKTKAARPPAAPVDTRPRFKRDDTPAAVTAAKPAVAGTKRSQAARKPADAAQPGAGAVQAARVSAKDGAECAQVREPDRAFAGCTRIIEDEKQKPKARAAAYFNRGNAYSAQGEPDKAIADFDQAIKLDPKNAAAYNNRGNAHSDKGETERAVADFDAAIKQNARYASAYFNRANALAANGETARAIKDYDAAIRNNRRNVNAYIARGALHLAGGAAAKARADMSTAARMERTNAYAVLWQDIAERRAKQKGVLAQGAKGMRWLDMKGWPAPVIHLYAGELKPDALLVAADNPNAATKLAHVCEANFYSGEYALIQGQRDEAVKLFRLAAKECPRGFIEGIVAGAELKGLGENL